MKNNPSLERVIGGTDEQKDAFQNERHEELNQSGKEIFGDLLVEPTQEEKEAISSAVHYVSELSKKYGSNIDVSDDRIFLLESGGVEKETKGVLADGYHDSYSNFIAVDRFFSNAVLASTVVHELFHKSSYHSFQILEDGDSKLYRSGIEMRSIKNEENYFAIAQEAIVSILSERFFKDVIHKDPLYSEEIKKTAEIKDWLIQYAESKSISNESKIKAINKINNISILPRIDMIYKMLFHTDKSEDYKFGSFEAYVEGNTIFHERSEEKEKFNNVLDKMINDSNGELGNKEELFDHFARAHFTGNFLPLARLIDKALGKGSFRKIAVELGEVRG